MKLIYKILSLLFLSLVVLVACEKDDDVRIDYEQDLLEAVNLRIVRDNATFDSTDPEAATTFTYYTQNNNIEQVDVLVDYFNFAANTRTTQRQYTTLDGEELDNAGTKSLTVPLEDLTGLFGLEPSDLAGGDAFNIYHVVTLQDGRVYPDTILQGTPYETVNVDANIINSSATHSFAPLLTFPIVCPIAEEFAEGNYRVELVEGNNTTTFGRLFDIPAGGTTVSLGTAAGLNATQRQFSVGYLPDAVPGFTTTLTLDFACNVVLVPISSNSLGLGCGGVSLAATTNTANAGTFDIADDSEFLVSLRHNPNNACGLPQNAVYTLRFTKL